MKTVMTFREWIKNMSVSKIEILLYLNQVSSEEMKNWLPHNVFKEVIGLEASCEERGRSDAAEGSIMWLASINAWINTALACLTKKESREGQMEKLYLNTYGRYLVVAADELIENISVYG